MRFGSATGAVGVGVRVTGGVAGFGGAGAVIAGRPPGGAGVPLPTPGRVGPCWARAAAASDEPTASEATNDILFMTGPSPGPRRARGRRWRPGRPRVDGVRPERARGGFNGGPATCDADHIR